MLLNSFVGEEKMGIVFWREYITSLLIIRLLTSKDTNSASHPFLDCFVPPVSDNAAVTAAHCMR